MPETTQVPGLGGVKKQYVYVGGAVLVAGVAYYYYRKRQQAAATASTDTSQNPIDPATGYPQDSPQDLAALAQQGQTFLPGQSVSGSSPNSPSYTYPSAQYATNDAWAQGATDYLVNVEGQDPGQVGTALALYLAGEPMSPAQKVIVEMAEAYASKPPIPGPNGYPPNIKEQSEPVKVPTSYGVQLHRFGTAVNARGVEEQYSDKNANANEIEVALQKTARDPRNARYMGYYEGHGGMWPAQSAIYVTVVTRAASTLTAASFSAHPAVPA